MNEAHEELLRRVATGGLRADAPDVRAAAEGDAEFARELEATIDVLERLDEEAAEQARVLERAGELTDAPGEARVAAFVEERVAEAAARGRRRWIWIAAAVAAVVALAVFVAPLFERDRDTVLGPWDVRCIYPVETDEPADFSVFRWESRAEDGWFEITVTDPASDEVLKPSPRIRGQREWRPPEDDHRAWPRTIIWKVEWVTEGGVHGKGRPDIREATRR